MKSSSQLFPVQLVSADVRSNYFQDVYSLKPNNSSDKSVEIALLHLHQMKDSTEQKQVLFVHDAFNSHWQWMDNGAAQQLISELLQMGVSVWLMDWRSHGSSRKNKKAYLNTMDEMARFDMPAVTSFIQEKNANSLQIVAKGYGAHMVLKAMPEMKGVDQFFLVDAHSPIPKKRYLIPGVLLIKRLKLFGKKWIRGQGDEPEPVNFFKALLKQAGWLSLIGQAGRNKELISLYQAIAHRIVWVCTARGFERVARRLTSKQARIHRVSTSRTLEELGKLITSQSI